RAMPRRRSKHRTGLPHVASRPPTPRTTSSLPCRPPASGVVTSSSYAFLPPHSRPSSKQKRASRTSYTAPPCRHPSLEELARSRADISHSDEGRFDRGPAPSSSDL